MKQCTPKAAAETVMLFETWTDASPELIGIFEGTPEAVRAWCDGFNYAIRNPHETGHGMAIPQTELLRDPKLHGLTGTSEQLIACAGQGDTK